MNGASALDLVLLLLILRTAVSGWRLGALWSVCTAIGTVAGVAVALGLVRDGLRRGYFAASTPGIRLLACLAVLLGLLVVGQSLGAAVGARLRRRIQDRGVAQADRWLGLVVRPLVACLLVWFVAGAVRGRAPTAVSHAVAHSRVLSVIDKAMPAPARAWADEARSVFGRTDYPSIVTGLTPEPIRPVAPPATSVGTTSGLRRAAPSVVKVVGEAMQCGTTIEGSGWVFAPHRVMTNAHVVAGTSSLTVQVEGTGPFYRATVVLYDPERDVAVLSVPALGSAPLARAGALAPSAAAVAAGFPLDGPYTLSPMRVRSVLEADGQDIYGRTGPRRQVYSLAGSVTHGNSGGPLFTPAGSVAGMIFAASMDNTDTAYALTNAELGSDLALGAAAGRAVGTGRCAAL